MSKQKGASLQKLLASWTPTGVHTSSYLNKAGYSNSLIHRYKKSGWIYSIGSGAFGRNGEKTSWEGAVYAMQSELNLKIHLGGLTALALQGASHYVPLSKSTLNLYGQRGTNLPAWFEEHKWDVRLKYHQVQLFEKQSNLGLIKYKTKDFTLEISTRERAILEFLHLVPQQESFEHARLLMQGLINLKPALVQELLLLCNSIKVKRLFMILAELYEMPWLSRLDTDSIDFGRSRRVLAPGGRIHRKYLLTVPADYFNNK